jgi:hypothetical protein
MKSRELQKMGNLLSNETRNENNIYLLLSLSEIKVNERIFSSVDHLN